MCYTFTGGPTFAKNENRISKIIRAKNARSSIESFKSSTRQENYMYNCKYSNKRIGNKKIVTVITNNFINRHEALRKNKYCIIYNIYTYHEYIYYKIYIS